VIWSAGHSNRPAAALVETLLAAGIELVVDVRRYPMSRRNPQFNREALAQTLRAGGISYLHEPALGGRRKPQADSKNLGLRDEGFRGFADYMASDEFEQALADLIERSASARTALMCAEALPWRCHRSLIADALVARGLQVEHLLGAGATRHHELTSAARVIDGRVSYPALL
jgi:uncharacterized protein (DUF488 family)